VLADVLADDLALVDGIAGPQEEGAPRLEVVDRVPGRPAFAVRHQGAGGPARDVPVPRGPAIEQVVQEPRAPRVGQELRAVADPAPGGAPVLEAAPAGSVVGHLDHLAPAPADLLGDDADVLLGAVDDQVLHGLEPLPVFRAGDDLGLPDLELVALA